MGRGHQGAADRGRPRWERLTSARAKALKKGPVNEAGGRTWEARGRKREARAVKELGALHGALPHTVRVGGGRDAGWSVRRRLG